MVDRVFRCLTVASAVLIAFLAVVGISDSSCSPTLCATVNCFAVVA